MNNNWILVSDKLPDDDKIVLVSLIHNNCPFTPFTDFGSYNNITHKWKMGYKWRVLSKVVRVYAWQQLPEPYMYKINTKSGKFREMSDEKNDEIKNFIKRKILPKVYRLMEEESNKGNYSYTFNLLQYFTDLPYYTENIYTNLLEILTEEGFVCTYNYDMAYINIESLKISWNVR